MDGDYITHTRLVYGFMDWIGDMGGVPGIMRDLCASMVGGWGAFHSAFMTMSALYRVISEEEVYAKNEDFDEDEPHL